MSYIPFMCSNLSPTSPESDRSLRRDLASYKELYKKASNEDKEFFEWCIDDCEKELDGLIVPE